MNDGIKVFRDAGVTFPIRNVGYGVDTAQFANVSNDAVNTLRKQLGIAEDAIVIGYIGRLKYMKGVDLLLDAFARLAREKPRARLMLVGSGEEEIMLRSKSAQL